MRILSVAGRGTKVFRRVLREEEWTTEKWRTQNKAGHAHLVEDTHTFIGRLKTKIASALDVQGLSIDQDLPTLRSPVELGHTKVRNLGQGGGILKLTGGDRAEAARTIGTAHAGCSLVCSDGCGK